MRHQRNSATGRDPSTGDRHFYTHFRINGLEFKSTIRLTIVDHIDEETARSDPTALLPMETAWMRKPKKYIKYINTKTLI